MKPPAFAYLDPSSMTEALEALGEYGEEAKILAGGQSLVPLLNMRLAQPAVLIDINRIPGLQGITRRERGGRPGIQVSAVTRQSALERSPDLVRSPVLQQAIHWVGHPQIRNRGTVGGSIAHADPAAELPLVFRLLDGVAVVRSMHRERSIPAADFFLYTFTTDVQPDELLTDIWFPLAPPRTGQAFLEVARRHGDFALVSAAVSISLDPGGRCVETRIALGGVAPIPIRVPEAEGLLVGQVPRATLLDEAAALATVASEPAADVHADAAYRREVAGTLVRRALAQALERFTEGSAA